MKPLVSVWMVTYNHEKYIAEALESVLMQQTNFDFEIVIGEDCSTDQTRRIIKDYEHKYPNIIFPIYHDKNVGGMRNAYEFTLPLCRGKYIACLEGDDYWIDPLKLQKQVDLMAKNPDCSLCFHASKNVNASNPELFEIYRPIDTPKDNRFGVEHAIKYRGGLMATNAMLFKTECVIDIPDWCFQGASGDLCLTLLMASHGDMLYIDEVMSAYRVAAVGSWSLSIHKNPERIKTHYANTANMWRGYNLYTKGVYKKAINKVLRRNAYICKKFFLKQALIKIVPFGVLKK